MYPRTEYKMTEGDRDELLSAMKPTPVMMIGGSNGPSQQENANRAWAKLGERMGFDPMTVQPIPSKGSLFFSAVPNENEEMKAERLRLEAEDHRQAEIQKLTSEIAERESRLRVLQGDST